MKRTIPVYILILWVLLACDDKDPVRRAPGWATDLPLVVYGASTVDLNLQTLNEAKVYWRLEKSSLNLNARDLKNSVLGRAAEDNFQGITDTPANELKLETISGLQQHTKYFLYLVAQNSADTTLQDEVKVYEFTTHSRQDTLEYNSIAENRTVKYLLYRPEEALKYPNNKYPICFFLGGNGEVATVDHPINIIRNGSLPEYIHKGNDVPMMVMSIQHTQRDWKSALIDEGVNHALETYSVDSNRVYMTGISGGGFGCWNYAVDHPDKLTAIVPISGGGNTGKACVLKNLNIWAFHNVKDGIVDAANTENMITAVKACPPKKEVKKLIFPDEGHDCWRRVYDPNHVNWNKSPDVARFDIYQWLLSKSK